MEKLRPVLHPVETFRTAPFWISRTLGGASLAAVGFLSTALEVKDAESEALPIGAGIVMASLGMNSVRRDSRAATYYYRTRLQMEAALERRGYSDQLVMPTLSAWCVRQATIVACEQHSPEAAQRYRALIKEHKDILPVSCVPHI